MSYIDVVIDELRADLKKNIQKHCQCNFDAALMFVYEEWKYNALKDFMVLRWNDRFQPDIIGRAFERLMIEFVRADREIVPTPIGDNKDN